MFIRRFDDNQIKLLTSDGNAQLFAKLKRDIILGEVFTAIRKDELHFYYKGGCLYKFARGRFVYNKEFEKYGNGTEGLSPYEKAKKQVENKFKDALGNSKERQRLDELYWHTFGSDSNSKVVVLDIEVNLNGDFTAGKKCDLVLLNTQSQEIMFVEGKVFSDRRVKVKSERIPEVIAQVNIYTQALEEQSQNIIKQYANCIGTYQKLFDLNIPMPKSIVSPAKLLVYDTPICPTENQKYSIDIINSSLGKENVAFIPSGVIPSIDEIWNELYE